MSDSPERNFEKELIDAANSGQFVSEDFDPMKLDPDYVYTEKDFKWMRRHNIYKKITSVVQATVLLSLVGLFIFVVFNTSPPEALMPPKSEWTQRDGFIALSYAGIARKEKKGERSVSRQQLERHMKALKEAGYHIVTTEDVIDFYWKGDPLPDKALYLMFEGGRKDSAIFSQRILKKYNLRATMYLQTARLKRSDRFFIRTPELEVIAKNPYWDIGSQGYELRHINVMEDGGYGFFLTDYLRDKYRNAIESEAQLRERLEDDYEKGFDPFKQYTGRDPEAYIFMPANTLWRSIEGPVETINAELIHKYYKIVFAREGFCYNTKDTAPYNLTRTQIYPDWSVNRLLLEIEASSPTRHVYQQADDETFNMWQTDAGALSTKDGTLILTAPKSGDAVSSLRGSDVWENVDMSVVFGGSQRGTQKIYLRYASSASNICATLSRNFLTITETVPRRGTSILYETALDYRSKDVTGIQRDAKGAISLSKQGIVLDPLRFILIGNRLTIRYGTGDSTLLLTGDDPIPISEPVSQGRIALGSLGENEPYDAVFEKLVAKPIDHRWILPDPIEDSMSFPRSASEDVRTGLLIPVGGTVSSDWSEAGSRVLYNSVAEGEAVFAQLPDNNYDVNVIEGPWSTVSAEGLVPFLTGVVLSPGNKPVWKALNKAAAQIHEKGLQVAIRLSRSSALSLLKLQDRPAADWIICNFADRLPKDQETALQSQYDKSRILRVPKVNPGVPAIYTWMGEDNNR